MRATRVVIWGWLSLKIAYCGGVVRRKWRQTYFVLAKLKQFDRHACRLPIGFLASPNFLHLHQRPSIPRITRLRPDAAGNTSERAGFAVGLFPEFAGEGGVEGAEDFAAGGFGASAFEVALDGGDEYGDVVGAGGAAGGDAPAGAGQDEFGAGFDGVVVVQAVGEEQLQVLAVAADPEDVDEARGVAAHAELQLVLVDAQAG